MMRQWKGDYPNVRARLRRTRKVPGAPDATTTMVIWLDGSRFRVRDETGRRSADLVGDITVPRGFGIMPRTLEDFMDATAASYLRADREPTDLYGDRATGAGLVCESGGEPWSLRAARLLPVAEQLLLAEGFSALDPVERGRQLGRPVDVYHSVFEGDEDGYAFRTQVRRAVNHPFVLSSEVRDSRHHKLFVQVDVLELDEGVVSNADLIAPARAA